jgi:Carboxypeptidase regulatory-like domain
MSEKDRFSGSSAAASAFKPLFIRRLALTLLIKYASVVLLGMMLPLLLAQNQTGNIHGRVTDPSGAAIPGVTITLTSPALLVPQKTTADAAGNYRFEQLPLGTYALNLDQTGFQQYIRQNIQITAGFSAEVNVQMVVGSVAQSVTISAAGPVIDTTSTAVSTSIGSVVIADELPVTRDVTDMVATTPGVTPTVAPDLGGGTLPSIVSSSYGISGQTTVLVDGVNARKSSGDAEGNYDFTTMEEFQVVPTAGNADVALPGLFINMVMKTGGNDYHGRAEYTGEDQSLESNNLTPLLRSQGNTTPNLILNDKQFSGNLGGRILRNKWWIFGGGYYNGNSRNDLGFVLPNGTPGLTYTRATNGTVKSTYQLSPNYKLIGFWTLNTFWAPNGGGSATTPYYSTVLHAEPISEWKGEVQATPNSHLVLNFLAGHHYYQADYYPHSEAAAIVTPSIVDTVTTQVYGPSLETDKRGHHQTQFTGNGSYLPAGTFFGHHQVKFGTTWMVMWTGSDNTLGTHVSPYGVPGNYSLVFANGVPTSVRVYNYPVTQNKETLLEGGIFLEDTWQINQRVTANVGLRWDSFATSNPPQDHPAGTFGTPWAAPAAGTDPFLWTGAAVSYPRVNTGTWRDFAPRVGIVWDLLGNGKTVYKASYGRYNYTPGDDFGAPLNVNTSTISTFSWSAPAGCTEAVAAAAGCDYIPGSVNLNPNGPSFQNLQGESAGGVSKLANSVQNPNLNQEYSNIFQTFLEHELAPNLSARVGFTYIQNVNIWLQIPTQIPFSAWSTQYTMYDQGPTTAACYVPVMPNTKACSAATLATAPHYTIYDLQPGYAQLTQTEYVNRPSDRSDHVQTIEATVTKRSTNGKWNLVANYTGIKEHVWIIPAAGNAGEAGPLPIQVNPNQEFFPLNTTWNWQARATGNYKLPWKFDVSGTFQIYNGLQGQRAESVPFPNAGATAISVEPFGSYTGPLRGLLNFRFARDFHFKESQLLRPTLELLNATNTAATWGVTTYNSGPTFGKISSTDTPRIFRFGAIYEF